MRKLRMTPGLEFAVVVTGAFGLFIAISLLAFLHPRKGLLLADVSLLRITIFEGVMLVVLGLFLRRRGWTLARLTASSRWYDIFVAIALAVAAHYAYFAAWYAVADITPALLRIAGDTRIGGSRLMPAVIVANAVVNGLYEEVFVTAYVITALKERIGVTLALNVSVAIRLLYHLNLGVAGILMIIPMGLIFGYWYVRTHRLWPLVISHTGLVLFSLFHFAKF
ncbi:MAG: CPBP family intramembrane metalloprotease [Alphaproteobacteria bacterium]|nr:CPBP family intramembrane metalloprotease [Alphaproteobacteria bacterium]